MNIIIKNLNDFINFKADAIPFLTQYGPVSGFRARVERYKSP